MPPQRLLRSWRKTERLEEPPNKKVRKLAPFLPALKGLKRSKPTKVKKHKELRKEEDYYHPPLKMVKP